MLRALLAAAMTVGAAPIYAGEIGASGLDLELKGGVSAAVFRARHPAALDQNHVQLTDFMVELVSAEPQARELGVTVGVGVLSSTTVLGERIGAAAGNAAGLQFGWVTFKPTDALSLEVGKLATNIGYEVRPTYDNTSITLSGMWTAQPNFYPGARANYTRKENTFYAEVGNYARREATHSLGLGLRGATGDVEYGANFFGAPGDRRLYDFVVTMPIGNVVAGVNVDYLRLENPTVLQDNHALGIGLHVLAHVGDIDVPLRIESLRDGTSGIYGVDHGWTATVTPTLNMGQAGFVRAELAYVHAGEDRRNPLTGARDSLTNLIAAVQMGTQF